MRKHTAAWAAAGVGVLAATFAFVPTRVVLAVECLAGPGGAAPAGHHWRYRLDHANNRKCWYLKNIADADTAGKAAAPRARRSPDRSDNETTSSIERRPAKEREALFEEFLRWQKRQESRR